MEEIKLNYQLREYQYASSNQPRRSLTTSEDTTDGSIIVGAGAGTNTLPCTSGTGLSTKVGGTGGADLMLVYNSGRFRMAGCEVLPAVKNVTVLAGVCGTNPSVRCPHSPHPARTEVHRLCWLTKLNHGRVNRRSIPTELRGDRDGFDREVEMIAEAHKQGLMTTYVFDTGDWRLLARPGR
ncbi:hypothetical protein N7490_007472 [Penicillium lividum]|nr:hypothetical protein N7490_007472 [Penicillium lividum]